MLKNKKIYNPKSTEDTKDRQVFGGNPTGIFELNDIKYQWAYNLWEVMINNTWFPKEIDLTNDVLDYVKLTQEEKRGYDLALAQLIFMDSIQSNNLMDVINPKITAPEINMCLSRQAFEESLHSQSYAVMIDSISVNTREIYELWRSDTVLEKKNYKIAKVYEDLSCNPTDEGMLKALVANQILEGIYFYSGFTFMFALARSGKMIGTSQMVKKIRGDENTHLILFQNMINSTRRDKPHLFTKELEDDIYDMFREAVDLESDWGKYITQGHILGLSDHTIRQYIESLADDRLKAIKLKPIYNATNPLVWVDDFANLNDQKTNFFEGNVNNYSKGSLDLDNF